ncbi:MAG: translation elongation factor Ts [Brevinemataceae bacterium]
MASVSMDDIKKLKEMTGAGLMDAKRTLEETNGNIDEAVKILRQKGLAKANKRAENEVKEGTVVCTQKGNKLLALRVNCETDFVAKTEVFQAFAQDAAVKLLEEGISSGSELSQSIDEERKAAIAKLGENVVLSEWKEIDAKGTLYHYIHMNKIVVAIDFDGNVSEENMKNIAMQIASMNPLGLTKDEIPQDLADKELDICTAKAKESGKPEAVIPKIVEGMMSKFYSENVLLEQPFVFDESKKVSDLLGSAKINSFIRISL